MSISIKSLINFSTMVLCLFFLLVSCPISAKDSFQYCGYWDSPIDKLVKGDGLTCGDSCRIYISDRIQDANGDRYIVGSITGKLTYGNIESGSDGDYDYFVMKCNKDTGFKWFRRGEIKSIDGATVVKVDNKGGIYIVGYSSDCTDCKGCDHDFFVTKYDDMGNEISFQTGDTGFDDNPYDADIRINSNGDVDIFVVGSTMSNSQNSGVSSYENMFVADFLFQKGHDPLIKWLTIDGDEKYSDAGEIVKVDKNGFVYVAGYTAGGFGGYTNNLKKFAFPEYIGRRDVFIAKYDEEGKRLGVVQSGTEEYDSIKDISFQYKKDGDIVLDAKGNTWAQPKEILFGNKNTFGVVTVRDHYTEEISLDQTSKVEFDFKSVTPGVVY